MKALTHEVVDATEFPMECERLPRGSLSELIEIVHHLPSNKAVRFIIEGSVLHITQHLRNAATRKGYKISIAIRANYIYIGKG